MPDIGQCSVCGLEKKLTPKNGNVVKHDAQYSGPSQYKAPACPGSGKLPKLWRAAQCKACGQEVRLMADGRLSKHWTDEPGGTQCVSSLKEAEHILIDELGATPSSIESPKTPDSPQPNGDSSEQSSSPALASEPSAPGRESGTPSAPSQTTSATPSAASEPSPSAGPTPPSPPSSEAMFGDAGVAVRAKPRKRVPLAGEALALSDWFDDLFFAYQHARERSLQPTIGPSEIGSKCMRKIAMKLSQRPEVNMEKDSYAAWFGTQGHAGLEEMLRWANESLHVERFLIEVALEFGSLVMPHGHSDAFDRAPTAVGFDRVRGVVIDWKFPGESALSKMHLDGCPEDYETQLHLYGYGQRLAGENVEKVALMGLPRERGDLSKKYVYCADYDESKALKAIAKAESIKARLDEYAAQGVAEPWKLAPKTTSFLCAYCPFYLANDMHETKGCSA